MLKCKACNKRLNSMLKVMYICRCQNYYCQLHLYEHNCSFNYKHDFFEQNKELLEIKPKKVESI